MTDVCGETANTDLFQSSARCRFTRNSHKAESRLSSALWCATALTCNFDNLADGLFMFYSNSILVYAQ